MSKPFDVVGWDLSSGSMSIDTGRTFPLEKLAKIVRAAEANLSKVITMAKAKYEIKDTKRSLPMPSERRYAAMAVTQALITLAAEDDQIKLFLNNVRLKEVATTKDFWGMVNGIQGK